MTVATLPHRLDRTVVIHAPPDVVFRYFTDSARWARWWGAGSTIDPRPGGKVHIRHPEGTEAGGEVLEVSPPRRIVFTYGYASGTPVAVGGSRVTLDLAADPRGTALRLTHELPESAARDQHVQGWRYQLSVFANVVADEVFAAAAETVDAWFSAWAEPDERQRERLLSAIAIPEVRFQDRFSNLDGVADILPHISAAQRFMPGLRLRRDGELRQCQGTILCDWKATGPNGAARGSGSNVFVLGPTGKIEWVTGFWSPPPQ